MRILELSLLRFGDFEDVTLPLDAGVGLHLIYGSNEAGKSTTLRALLGFLFGIPGNTVDAHRFPMRDLRVGATIVGPDGRALRLVRRKGNKDTLLGEDGNPVDEGVLGRLLRGVSPAAFQQLYGLSHERLVAGGEDLLAGRGELGESLFAAGSGIRGLHRLRAELADEAANLFAARAGIGRPLNRALEDFKSAKGRIQESQLLPASWLKLVDDRDEKKRRLATLEDEVLRRDADVVRIERITRVLPLVSQRGAALAELRSLGEVAVLLADAGERRAQCQEALRNIDLQSAKLADERSRLESDRGRSSVPTELLAHQEQVDALQESLGALKKAKVDLPLLEADVAARRVEADVILRDLGRSASWQEAEALRIDGLTRTKLQTMAAQHRELDTRQQSASKEWEEARQEVERLKGLVSEAPVEREVEAVRRLTKEVRPHGDLEAQVEGLDVELALLREKAAGLAAGLSGWRGELFAVRTLAVPLREEIADFQTTCDQLDEESRKLALVKDTCESDVRELERQLEELGGEGVLPSEDDLCQARADRNHRWSSIKSPWIEGDLPERAEREELAVRYEGAVGAADHVSDQIRLDASRAATEAKLERDLAARRLDGERASLGSAEVEVRRLATDERWRELWSALPVTPGAPGTMLAWSVLRERVLETMDAFDAGAKRREQLLVQMAGFRSRLSAELLALGEPDSLAAWTLGSLVTRAEELAADADEERRDRTALAERLREAENAARRRSEEAKRANDRLETWRQSWGAAAVDLGLAPTAGPDEVAAYLDGVKMLFETLDGAASKQTRIEHMLDDAGLFTREVESLVAVCLPPIKGSGPEEAARQLVQALHAGRAAASDMKTIDARLREISTSLADLAVERAAQGDRLQALVEQARCPGPDDLPQAESRSRRWAELTGRIADLEERLATEGQPLADLLAQVNEADVDQVPSLLEQARHERLVTGEEAGAAREELGGLQAQIAAVSGGNAAALAAADAEEALARVGVGVEHYVDLRLAALLLAREIERYRKEHQGPIIGLASHAFARLTLGSFVGLTTGFDAKDQQVLVCQRAGGDVLGVSGLSDGTRDQLYLALRLASIEHRLSLEESLPLMVDDILVNFDDDRARAALGLLGDLSAKTQVMLFTHHRRVLELARTSIPADRFREHDLDILRSRVS